MRIDDVLTTVSGKPITVQDVLVHLKSDGTFRKAIYELIEREVISAEVRKLGISLSEAELSEYGKQRRSALGLTDAVEMNDYCAWLGITFDQWCKTVERDLLRIRLMDQLVDEETTVAHYHDNKRDYQTVSLSRIVCETREELLDVKDQLEKKQNGFSTLAQQHSIEENTRVAGGYLGSIQTGVLPEEIENAVFEAETNQLLGPFIQNGYWVLYRVEHVAHRELDDALKRQITESLFASWLEDEVYKAKA